MRVSAPLICGYRDNSFDSLKLELKTESHGDTPRPARPWIGIYAATAVMMVIALGVLAWQAKISRREAGPKDIIRPAQVPRERLELLAHFEAPAYVGPEGSPEFQSAIQRYKQRDYKGAIAGLRRVLAKDSSNLEAHFYLGISLLLTGGQQPGASELRSVISAGNSRYLEPARFYLAKTLLAFDDIDAARKQLQAVEAMHRDLEKQAQSLLQQTKP